MQSDGNSIQVLLANSTSLSDFFSQSQSLFGSPVAANRLKFASTQSAVASDASASSTTLILSPPPPTPENPAIPVLDTTPPTAQLGVLPVATLGGTQYVFSVTYTDASGITIATLNSEDIEVSRVPDASTLGGAPTDSQLATLLNVEGTAAANLVATYQIAPPGGSWDAGDNGIYQIRLRENQVADILGNTAPQTVLGTFAIAFSNPTPPPNPPSTPDPALIPPAIVAGTAQYYVSADGNDSNSGTFDQPFATLNKAVLEIKNGSGGTIYLRGGTYYLQQGVWVGDTTDGSAQSHLVIRPYGTEKVVLDGSQMRSKEHMLMLAGEYIDVLGLEVRNGPDAGIIVLGGKHAQILNNAVYGTQSTGILALGLEVGQNGRSFIERATDVWMVGNEVYQTNLMNAQKPPNGIWGMGMQGMFADRVHIIDNTVHNNYGEGIGFTVATDSIAANNTVYDNFSVEMYMDNVVNSTFEKNLIYNTGNIEFYRYRTDDNMLRGANSIQLANEVYYYAGNDYTLKGITIRDNIVLGGEVGLYYGSYFGYQGMSNVLIENNTFYNSESSLLRLEPDAFNNVAVVNNLFYQTGNKALTFLPGVNGVSFSHNLWYGGNGNLGSAASSTDVTANPKLTNPGGFEAKDYQLLPGSAAIDAGANTSVNPTRQDYFGDARLIGAAIDIGADEFVG
jgi:parallel beta-helix repeat protein